MYFVYIYLLFIPFFFLQKNTYYDQSKINISIQFLSSYLL